MTTAQRITVRLSECRQRLNELLGVEGRNDEQQTELEKLTGEVQKLEPELRAAIAAEGADQRDTELQFGPVRTPEERERDDLHGLARLGNYLLAAMQGREPSGPEHEFRSALGIRAGIPLALFEPTFEERATALRRREVRADVATTIPATGTGTTVAPVPAGDLRALHCADAWDRHAGSRERRLLDAAHADCEGADRRASDQGSDN